MIGGRYPKDTSLPIISSHIFHLMDDGPFNEDFTGDPHLNFTEFTCHRLKPFTTNGLLSLTNLALSDAKQLMKDEAASNTTNEPRPILYCMKSGDTIVCRCRMERSSKSHTISCEHQSKSSSNETDYWTANPCQPWANLFNSSNDTYFGRTDRYSSIGSPIFATETHSGMPLSSHAMNRHDVYPAQVRRKNTQQKSNVPRNTPAFMPSYIIIGHPSLRIYKFSLPNNLLHLLQHIVDACQNHAQSLRSGWKTYLYSLTKQDIAVRDIDGLYEVSIFSSSMLANNQLFTQMIVSFQGGEAYCFVH